MKSRNGDRGEDGAVPAVRRNDLKRQRTDAHLILPGLLMFYLSAQHPPWTSCDAFSEPVSAFWGNVPRTASQSRRLSAPRPLFVLSPPSSSTAVRAARRQNRGPRSPRDPPDTLEQRDLAERIRKLARTGCASQAIDLFLSSTGIRLPDGNGPDAFLPQRVQLSPRLMNAAVDACGRHNPVRIRDAAAIFEMCTAAEDPDGLYGALGLTPCPRPGRRQMRRLRAVLPNVHTFGSLLNILSRMGHVDAAMRTLYLMRDGYNVEPNAVCYTAAISACDRAAARSGVSAGTGRDAPWHQALALVEEANAKTSGLTVVGYNAALSALARSGKVDEAVFLCYEASERKVQMDAISYSVLMRSCERAERWTDMLKFAVEMEANGFEMDGLALSGALHACERTGDADGALAYLDKMKNLQTSTSGDETNRHRRTHGRKRDGAREDIRGPDGVAYALAVGACARAGRLREALGLLDEMKKTTPTAHLGNDNKMLGGKTAEVVAYTAAIGGCAKEGQWKVAMKLIYAMRERNITPNVITYSAAINACAAASAAANNPGNRTRPMNAALDLLTDMKRRATDMHPDVAILPNVVTYNAAAKACAEGWNPHGAFSLVKEMTYAGLEPNVVTFGTLMAACERIGKADEVARVFGIMEKLGVKPNEIVYGAAISCHRKAGEGKNAFLLLRKMVNEGLSPNIATYNTVLLALIEACHVRQVIRVFEYMESSKCNVDPNVQTFSSVIYFLALKKKPLEADNLIQHMRMRGLIPGIELYTVTVTAFEKMGMPMRALRLMDDMREDGHAFYDIKVIDGAVKGAVKLANRVGRLASPRS